MRGAIGEGYGGVSNGGVELVLLSTWGCDVNGHHCALCPGFAMTASGKMFEMGLERSVCPNV